MSQKPLFAVYSEEPRVYSVKNRATIVLDSKKKTNRTMFQTMAQAIREVLVYATLFVLFCLVAAVFVVAAGYSTIGGGYVLVVFVCFWASVLMQLG